MKVGDRVRPSYHGLRNLPRVMRDDMRGVVLAPLRKQKIYQIRVGGDGRSLIWDVQWWRLDQAPRSQARATPRTRIARAVLGPYSPSTTRGFHDVPSLLAHSAPCELRIR